MNEKKEYSRSIRMTDTVRKHVESFSGNGFNEKFENMVLFCKEQQADIEAQIKEKQKYLNELNSDIAKKRKISSSLDHIKYYIDQATDLCKDENVV